METAIVQKSQEEIITEGFTILEDVIDDTLFAKMKHLGEMYMQRTYQRYNASGNLLYNLFRTESLLYDFLLPEVINNDLIHNVVTSLLGKKCHLKETLIFFSYPNNDKQALHSDVYDYFPEQEIELPATVVAVQFPMSDFNVFSGGTRIVPRTQNVFGAQPDLEEEEKLEGYEVITPQVNKKSCLIRDCRAWHGAGVNQSEEVRAMYTFVYTRNWCSSKGKVSKDLYFNLDRDKRHLVTV